MTTKTSTKLKKAYEKDLAACKNINELVWIYTDIGQDNRLTCDDQLKLIRDYQARSDAFKKAGDKYSIARKPAFRR